MWLEDLQRENRLSRHAFHEHRADPDRQRHDMGLTRQELARLALKTQELREELAATVRRVDPSEYSAERIQKLLTAAKQNRQKR